MEERRSCKEKEGRAGRGGRGRGKAWEEKEGRSRKYPDYDS